jgi:glycosyltransferase involved in cell wall biosynthesis
MFCATSEAWLDDRLVYPGFVLYDRREVDLARVRPWREREPLLVVHGSLYKVVAPGYLATVLALLREDPELELVLLGKESGGERARLEALARDAGVGGRVRYEGAFAALRDPETGVVDDPGWRAAAAYLERARLVPDPWPVGGASSVVEAFALGAPVVRMGVRTDPAAWRLPQPCFGEMLAFDGPPSVAYSAAEYAALCRRVLADERFADRIAAEQLEIARRITDPAAFWDQLLGLYRDWAERQRPGSSGDAVVPGARPWPKRAGAAADRR